MSQFSRLIITKAGQELISEVLSGNVNALRFTKVSVSAAEYDLSEPEGLTELSDVRQTSLISRTEKSGESVITVEAALTNEQITEGYYMRAIGLFAETADSREILYAVTVEQSGNCYMPPFNGLTVSGAVIKLIVAVGNAESITLETNSAAVATAIDVKRLEDALAKHRTDAAAHGSILGNISRLECEVKALKLRIDTNITANPFTVTFDTLDGLNVSGVFNAERGTVDF